MYKLYLLYIYRLFFSIVYIKYNVLYNQLTFTYSTKYTLNDIYINIHIHSTLVTLYFISLVLDYI